MFKTYFFYHQNVHFKLFTLTRQNFNIIFCKKFIGTTKVTKKVQFSNTFEFQKFIQKKNRIKKKKEVSCWNIYIGQFYIQISLEEFWFIQIVLFF